MRNIFLKIHQFYSYTRRKMPWVLLLIAFTISVSHYAQNKRLSESFIKELEKLSDKDKIEQIRVISENVLDSIFSDDDGASAKLYEIAKSTRNADAISRAFILMSVEQYNRPNFTVSKSELKRHIDILPENSSCKANAVNLLANVYYNEGSIKQAMESYKYAVALFESSGQMDEAMITHEQIINIFIAEKNYHQAIESIKLILKYFEKKGNIKYIASQYVTLSKVYFALKNIDLAKKYFNKALDLHKKLGHDSEITELYFGYTIYMSGNDKDSALYILKKAMQLSTERNDIRNIGICNMNIGDHYLMLKDYAKAEDYYLKALEINKSNNISNGVSFLMLKLSNLKIIQGNYKDAEKYQLNAIEIDEKSSNLFGLVHGYSGMADIKMKGNDFNSAMSFYKKAYEISSKIRNTHSAANMLFRISNCYKKLSDYKNALIYYEKYHLYSDSVFNEAKHKQITELLTKYETHKKDNEISLLSNKNKLKDAELSKKEFQRNSLIIGILLMIGFSFVVFRNYRQKKKAHQIIKEKNQNLEMANSEILTQRDEIESQRDMVTKQKEQIEIINVNLTDSINYAKRIQNAVLSSGNFKHDTFADNFVLFKPKDIVSGDFYWTAKVNEWLIITVADCTGHGVPGAFMSLIGVSFLNEIVRKNEVVEAGAVLNLLRESIIEALQQKGDYEDQKDGMDIALCSINTNTYEMHFAGANNACYIVTKNYKAQQYESLENIISENDDHNENGPEHALLVVKGDKQPIGIYSNMKPFTNKKIILQKGDTLYLATDGYEDQFGGPKGKKFSAKRLRQLLLENYSKTMIVQKEILDIEIEDWKRGGGINYEQIDDITLLGFKL